MKQNVNIFFILLAYLYFSQLDALNRDYRSDCEEDNTYQFYYKPYCLRHAPGDTAKKKLSLLSSLIPATGPKCINCNDSSIYLGYLDLDFIKYLRNLKQQLEYNNQHSDCICLWPEYSQEAAQISDTAYLLFRDLVSTTALSNLLEDENAQREFVANSCWFLNRHGLTIFFIVHQFRFSDYYRLCRDIENFAISRYDEREAAEIKDKLDDILESLYQQFFFLYTICYKKHPNFEIDQEIRFMKLLVNDISGLDKTVVSTSLLPFPKAQKSYDVSEFIVTNLQTINCPVEFESKGVRTYNRTLSHHAKSLTSNASSLTVHLNKALVFLPQSDIFFEQGSLLNDLLLYKESIEVLTQAIQLNPFNRDAYIERAMAYFETNQLSLALEDYESAKMLTVMPPFKPGINKSTLIAAIYIPENKTEFSKGLLSGTVEGAKVSAVEFVPSIFSCCRGIFNGLWAFVCSPIEISQEMVNTAYAIGEFVSHHSSEECFQCVVPELKELSISWDTINDHSRGKKIGFIIGKYGVDIFAPAGALKGMKKVRALKRANTMCTLENCTGSQIKQAKIIEESTKRASIREKIISDSIKSGKILVRNSNTQAHIMQPKHAWDKLVKISGNAEEDCKKVIKLLEDNQIFLEKYRLNPTETYEKLVRYNHQMNINGHEVKAIFNKNIETGEMFLNDAWVMIK